MAYSTCGNQEPAPAPYQEFLPIGGELRAASIVNDRRLLPLLQVVGDDRALRRAGAGAGRNAILRALGRRCPMLAAHDTPCIRLRRGLYDLLPSCI